MEKILKATLVDGQFQGISEARSNMMKAVKAQGNHTTEIKFCEALINEGILGWERQSKMIGNPDVFFPHYNIAVFLDGCFWHGCLICGHIPKSNFKYWQTKLKRNIERDLAKTSILQSQGFVVLRFWEHEILNDLTHCVGLLKEKIEYYLNEL